jgi:hypothetical protein
MPNLNNLRDISQISQQYCFDMEDINQQIQSNQLLLSRCINDISGRMLKCCNFEIGSPNYVQQEFNNAESLTIDLIGGSNRGFAQIPYKIPLGSVSTMGPTQGIYYQDFLLANPDVRVCCIQFTGDHSFLMSAEPIDRTLSVEIILDLYCGGIIIDSYSYFRTMEFQNGEAYESFTDPQGMEKVNLTAFIEREQCSQDLEIRPRFPVWTDPNITKTYSRNLLVNSNVEITCV